MALNAYMVTKKREFYNYFEILIALLYKLFKYKYKLLNVSVLPPQENGA